MTSTLDSPPDAGVMEWGDAAGQQRLREARLFIGNCDLDTAGIGDVLTTVRAAGLREFKVLSDCGSTAAIHVVLEGRLDEARLSALPSVERWALLAESAHTATYVFECGAEAFPPSLVSNLDAVTGAYDVELTTHGILMSVVGPDGTIADVIEECEAAGFSPDIRKLGSYDGFTRALDVLTERQREVLRVAFDMQYYAVPRKASVADIAAELDVESSTVAEHLQRAEAKLLGHLLPDHH